jgi:hypothetical protein
MWEKKKKKRKEKEKTEKRDTPVPSLYSSPFTTTGSRFHAAGGESALVRVLKTNTGKKKEKKKNPIRCFLCHGRALRPLCASPFGVTLTTDGPLRVSSSRKRIYILSFRFFFFLFFSFRFFSFAKRRS